MFFVHPSIRIEIIKTKDYHSGQSRPKYSYVQKKKIHKEILFFIKYIHSPHVGSGIRGVSAERGGRGEGGINRNVRVTKSPTFFFYKKYSHFLFSLPFSNSGGGATTPPNPLNTLLSGIIIKLGKMIMFCSICE